MTFKKISAKKRRGLSSIVGALLFVVLMVSAFAVLGVALNSQTDIASTSSDVSAKNLQKAQEKFTLNTVVQLPTENLQVNLTNNGQNAAEMFTLVMTNQSDAGQPTRTFEIPSSTSFLAPGSTDPTDIVSTLNLKMDTPAVGFTENYEFKVISSLGTIKKIEVECNSAGFCGTVVPPVGSGSLQAQIFTNPSTGVNTKTATVVLLIQNEGAGSVFNVSPLNDCATMTIPPAGGSFDPCILDSPDPFTELLPGSTAVFKWDGTVNGAIDDIFTFCNGGIGFEADLVTPVPPSGIPCDDLEVIDPTDCGGCGPGGGEGGATVILIDDLLTRPSLFMVIPSPFGQESNDGDQGVWGVNLVNPTEVNMTVSKVTMVVYPPTANDNDSIIPSQGPSPHCDMTMIQPTSDWSCPKENTILWQNNVSPIPLPKRSAVEFLVAVEPGAPSAGTDIDALIVQANVFTTLGSFGKGEGYQSTMRSGDTPLVNVFLTEFAENKTSVHGVRDDMSLMENMTSTLMVSIADMDSNPATYIENGTNFIINVPRKWTDVEIIDSTGFLDDTNPLPGPDEDSRVTKLGDESTQIIAVTAHDIGAPDGPIDKDVITLTFQATPPCNTIVGEKNPYIMYILADGKTGPPADSFPIGPLDEIALIVEPDLVTTCVLPPPP